MLRETLTAAIEKAANTEGYLFHTGFAYRINNGIARFPAAWLLPVRIIEVMGRHESRGFTPNGPDCRRNVTSN